MERKRVRRSHERRKSYVKGGTGGAGALKKGVGKRTKKPRKKKIVCKKRHMKSGRVEERRGEAYEEAMEKVYKTRKGTIKV